jgi:diguanylate cyclase (GGDEF)-like protein/PAS domain S-box-containing protein
MTRDPAIVPPAAALRAHAAGTLNRIALEVGGAAALAVALCAAAISGTRLRAFGPWSDLGLALLVASVVGVVAARRWAGALAGGASSRWHRDNGLLLLVPASFSCAFFMIELARIAWSLPLVLALAAPTLALVAGGGMRWLLALARAEAAIESARRGEGSAARTVGFGVAGIVVLLLVLGVARNIEYLGRIEAAEPVARLLEQAGRQRMLGQRVARLAARIEVEGVDAPTLSERFDEAVGQLDALGPGLAAEVATWTRQRGATESDPAILEVAVAADARSMLLARARDFRGRLAAGEPARTEYSRLQAEADLSVTAFNRAVVALSSAAESGRVALRRTAGIGFAMLALVALLGGGAVARATTRLVRAQQRMAADWTAELDRLATVVRNTRAIVVTADPLGRITWVNPAFEDLTGWSGAEVLGRTPGSVLQCPETDPATVAVLREALRARRAVRVDILNRRRDGRQYWVDLAIEPQFDDAGRHVGFISFETDITETVILRQRQRALFDAMAAGVVVQDADGAIIDCNQAACRLLGLDEDQLRGRTSMDPRWSAVRDDGSPMPGDEHFTMHTLRTGEAVSGGSMGVQLPDGTRRWLEVSTRLVPGERPGERAVVASFLDVTNRRDAAEAVSLERARLTAALDGTNAGVWHWRVADGRVAVDARWAEINGEPMPPGGVVPIGEWMRRLHPDDGPVARETAQMHFLGLTERYDAELRIRHRDGRWRWVHCRGRLTERDATGAPKSMFGTLVDITARKEAAAAAASEQHKLRTLFDLAPVGVALARDEDGAIIDCNLALCALLDRSPSDLEGRNLRDLTPVDGLREWESRNADFRRAGRVGPYEKEYLRPDGTRVPVLVSARRVSMSDGGAAIWVIVQDMSERKAMERGLQVEARTDKLTGLANRAALMERLESAVQQARVEPRAGFGLLFLDFDRFKLVNDTLGHEAGDELLRQIAQRLRGALRLTEHGPGGGTFVARIGGDEFVVLVAGASDVRGIERVARRLLGALSAPYPIRGSEVQSSASIGVVSTAQCELDASALLRDADTAMYEAKRRGRGVAVVFDDSMRSRLQRQVEVERNLRRAIAHDELGVRFQPIVDLETGVVASVEALLRWTSAELGEVSPSEFIPIAEDSGQIIEIGVWVLEAACRQFAAWRAIHPQSNALVSVNLSRVQLGKPDLLLSTVERVLDQTGLPADRLQLEVTERDVMRDPAAVLLLMRHLRALGVRLAMDDFGTGTSSLACLRDYPFDVIKIDRAFVGDLGSNGQVLALVHATMMLIENLGMTSVAEGVETTAQAAILQSVGCRLAQGWLFGQPMVLSDLLPRLGADG